MSPRRSTDSDTDRGSESRVAVKYGAMELAAKGSQAIYVVGLVVAIVLVARELGPVIGAVRDVTVALHDTSASLRSVAEDVRAARSGVEALRVAQVTTDAQLGRVLSEIASLRVAVEKPCKR